MKDASYTEAQKLAERVRDTMFATDKASHGLGLEISEISPGHASVTMTVREDMLNGFGIDFVAPGRAGDVLTARCHEVTKAGRTGVYDTEVTNQRGERIAVFRGRSYTIKGKPAV